MSERVKSVSVVLRVDTDRRRLECIIDVPDGAPHTETAFLITEALVTIGGVSWHEVPRVTVADADTGAVP